MKKLRAANILGGTKSLVALVAVSVFAVVLLLPNFVSAVGSLYLSSSASTLQNGQSVSVSVRLNPGTDVSGVEATVTYDQSKLQYVSTDANGSAFDVGLLSTGGGGTVRVERGKLGIVNSDSLVTRVNFTALVGSGSTTVSVSGNASLSGSYTGPSGGSTSISFITPSGGGGGGGSGGGSGDSGGGSGSGGTSNNAGGGNPKQNTANTPTTPTAPDSDNLGVEVSGTDIQLTKAKINVSTTKDSIVYAKYGLSEGQLLMQTAGTQQGKNHEIFLDEGLMIPGTKYFYQIVAVGSDGETTIKEVGSFMTKGIPVQATISDMNGKPVSKSKVTLHSDPIEATTDRKGVANFENVAPGEHKIEYKQGGKVYSKTVIVENSVKTDSSGMQTADVQNFSIIYDDLAVAVLPLQAVIIAVIAFIAIASLVAMVLTSKNPGGPFGRLSNRLRSMKKPGNGSTPDSIIAGGSTIPAGAGAEGSQDLVSKVKGPDQKTPGSVITPKSGDGGFTGA